MTRTLERRAVVSEEGKLTITNGFLATLGMERATVLQAFWSSQLVGLDKFSKPFGRVNLLAWTSSPLSAWSSSPLRLGQVHL
jgi:hypothetical protein